MQLSRALWVELCAHALSDPVHEVCGVLLGKQDPVCLQEVVRGENVATERQSMFLLDAKTLLMADAQARATTQDILGFYHSHPMSTPVPSITDRGLPWPDAIQLIVSVRHAIPVISAWKSRGTMLLPCILEFETKDDG